jgi:hypothetical protein
MLITLQRPAAWACMQTDQEMRVTGQMAGQSFGEREAGFHVAVGLDEAGAQSDVARPNGGGT